MDIRVELNANPGVKPQDASKLGFGKIFTDHMFMMEYDRENGWHDARIVPYGNICVSPASTVLHYGAEIFEGMKAYRRPDGEIQLFRPLDNFDRMNQSADRLCLPQIDPTSSTYLRSTPSSHSTWAKPFFSAFSPARMEAA